METTVGAQSLSLLGLVILSSSFPLITEMVWRESVRREKEKGKKEHEREEHLKAKPPTQGTSLGPAPALPTMVTQLQPPAAPTHTDPMQAMGIILHRLPKKIHYVLGGGGEGRLGWCCEELWERARSLAGLTAPPRQPLTSHPAWKTLLADLSLLSTSKHAAPDFHMYHLLH